MSADSDIERARLAASLIDNPLFMESMVILKETYLKALMACEPKDDLGRARYTFALADLHTVHRHIKEVLQRGELQAHEKKSMETVSPFRRAIRGLV